MKDIKLTHKILILIAVIVGFWNLSKNKFLKEVQKKFNTQNDSQNDYQQHTYQTWEPAPQIPPRVYLNYPPPQPTQPITSPHTSQSIYIDDETYRQFYG